MTTRLSHSVGLTTFDGRYVNVSGDTMTGALAVQATITANNLTLNQSDSAIVIGTAGGTSQITIYSSGRNDYNTSFDKTIVFEAGALMTWPGTGTVLLAYGATTSGFYWYSDTNGGAGTTTTLGVLASDGTFSAQGYSIVSYSTLLSANYLQLYASGKLTGPYGTGNWTLDRGLEITTGATGNSALTLQGLASQTASLLVFKNSAGTTLSNFDAAGALGLNTGGVALDYRLQVVGLGANAASFIADTGAPTHVAFKANSAQPVYLDFYTAGNIYSYLYQSGDATTFNLGGVSIDPILKIYVNGASEGNAVLSGSLTVGSLSGVLKASAGLIAGSATTTDLTEGANLYYTDARARAALSATSPITYSSATGVIASNSASANTASYLVQRDASGNFSAGQITATALTGLTSLAIAANGGLSVTSSNTDGNGGQFSLVNTYSTTVNKYLRLSSASSLEVVNSAYSAVLVTVTDAGNLYVNAGRLGVNNTNPSQQIGVSSTNLTTVGAGYTLSDGGNGRALYYGKTSVTTSGPGWTYWGIVDLDVASGLTLGSLSGLRFNAPTGAGTTTNLLALDFDSSWVSTAALGAYQGKFKIWDGGAVRWVPYYV